MKRSIILLAVFLCSAAGAFASEELDIYTYLYSTASTPVERLGILKGIAESKLDGAGQLYAQALAQVLLEQPTLRTIAEKEAADETVRLLSTLLGDSKYTAAAGDLWRVVQNFSNPLVKAEALIAMGRIRNPDYLEQILKTLSELNLKPTSDPEAGEKIAYGAILALEKYRAPAGYIPVFFASVGWYNRRIKEQAAKSLPYIIDDPSEPISAILLSSSYSYDVKLIALQKQEASKAAVSAKAAVAAIALGESWRASTSDQIQRMTLANTRKLSIDMLRRYGTSDAAVVPLLKQSYEKGVDTEERLAAVTALPAVSSDDAVRALSGFLLGLNTKRRDNNITQEDERMVRAVIPALGATASPLARVALRNVDTLDWTNAVKVLAAEALKKIP